MDQQAPVQQPVAEDQNQPSINDETLNIRKQVIDKISSSKNVLVTVNADPSVDELASVLGLTMMLNKLSKHVTAVFSGKIPSAMQFLDPEATFEDNVDSLRDFIIALDKEKADKLRYKVEDDVVKVFITPYQTVITEKDLQFSQGDFNVDVIIALGVLQGENLDSAISAHGKILHDAEVITITAGSKSGLGSIDWNNPESSSVAEMLVGIADDLGESLIDESIGTAFLTGLVAETNRFSNEKTTPTVMRIAAQLMAAGANQQLVATNLRQEGMISESIRTKSPNKDQPQDDNGEMVLNHQKQEQSKSANQSNNQSNKNKSVDNSNKQLSAKKPGQASDSSNKMNNQSQNQKNKPVVPIASEPSKQSEGSNNQPQEPEKNKVDSREINDTNKVNDLPKISPSKNSGDGFEPDAKQSESETTKPVFKAPDAPASDDLQPIVSSDPATEATAKEPLIEDLPVINPEKQASITEPPRFGSALNSTIAESEEEKSPDILSQTSDNQLFEHSNQDSNDAIAAARKAIEDAVVDPTPAQSQEFAATQPVIAAPQPQIQPVDSLASANQAALPPLPNSPVNQVPEASPVEDFMQPHVQNNFAPSTMNMQTVTSAPSPSEATMPGALPPLPPMPGSPADSSGMPPPLPMPGQPINPVDNFVPQINPGFMESVNQSQNEVTDRGDELAKQRAEAEATRQNKLDEIATQYDSAVDKNRELQGLPKVEDHSTFPLPPPMPGR